MSEFEIRNEAGTVLAILEVATGDRVDAELYAYRELAGAARIVPMPSSEAADARLSEAFQRLGLSESEAEIATEGRGHQHRVRRIRIGRQEATMPSIAPKPKRPVAALGLHRRGLLSESDTEKADEELGNAFKRLGMSESAATQAVRGRE